MKNFRYRYHGLCVDSEFPLPEWASFESTDGHLPPDVLISVDRSNGSGELPADSAEFRFFVRDAGWFTVRRGANIVVAPEVPRITRRLRAFLTGSAWGALLYQRNLLLLHASAVETNAGAVLFCGRRGQGKSTLAALLTEKGCKLISDDLCCVQLAGNKTPLVYPSAPRFKLWADSIHELGWDWNEPEQDHVRAGKFHYFRPSASALQPLPVRGIYLLGWGETAFERLKGFSALSRIFNAATWRGDLLVSAGDPADFFSQCTELVGRIPVWEFRRPRQFTAIHETTDLLMGHLSQN